MYKILKQQNNADNVWEFHVENGSIWGTEDVAVAVDKIEELVQTTPSQQLHLIEVINTVVNVSIVESTDPIEPVEP